MGDIGRHEEVVSTCLDQFVKKGLYKTTSRDLSKALKLQNAGLYYYFQSKDDAVIACAEEASFLLEDGLIVPALSDIYDPEILVKNLFTRADSLALMMRFLAQVCSANEYMDEMKPALFRLSQRYQEYAKRFAQKLRCDVQTVEPFVYMSISSISNYMLFGEQSYIIPQMEMVKVKLTEILSSANDESNRESKHE